MAAHQQRGSTDDGLPAREHAGAARVRAQVVGFLVGVIRWVGMIFAVILVVHVLLTVGGANPGNGIATFFTNWADTFSIGFKDLFTPDDAKLRVLVNDGIAAIFWLTVTTIPAKLLRRLA